MTPDIVFVDIETTGLDPDRHQLWELAAVHLDGRTVYGRWPVNLDNADGKALAMGVYYRRTATVPDDIWIRDYPRRVAVLLATLTSDTIIAGASPQFDVRFLGPWLKGHGTPPAWSHRLLDVCTYAAGAWGLPAPRSLSATLADAAIDHDSRAHTAMYDALQARRLWTQIAAESGVIADWPAHDLVVDRADQHVAAWDQGELLAPEPIDLPHDDTPEVTS